MSAPARRFTIARAPVAGVTIKQILCPTDFSEASIRALHHAIPIARLYDARLTALCVTPSWLPIAAGFPEYGNPVTPPSRDDVERELRAYLRPAEQAGLTCEVASPEGRPAEKIALFAEEWGADLIVMGTHGHGGFERLVLGSVTEKVWRKSPCPVLTVGPHTADDSSPQFARILCALDFSDASFSALDYAVSLAAASEARLDVVHVIDWAVEHTVSEPRFDLEDYRRHLADLALRRLQSAIPEAARRWLAVNEITTFGKPHTAILDLAAQKRSDLIVLGVRGHGALDRALFGSTAHHVVRGAPCPVLTIRT